MAGSGIAPHLAEDGFDVPDKSDLRNDGIGHFDRQFGLLASGRNGDRRHAVAPGVEITGGVDFDASRVRLQGGGRSQIDPSL
jgi:hypothetical protein